MDGVQSQPSDTRLLLNPLKFTPPLSHFYQRFFESKLKQTVMCKQTCRAVQIPHKYFHMPLLLFFLSIPGVYPLQRINQHFFRVYVLFGRANINLREKSTGAFAWEAAAAGVESKSESETRQREGFLMQQVQTRAWHFVFLKRGNRRALSQYCLLWEFIYSF